MSLASRFQTAVEGRPRPIGAGQNRYSGNVVWWGDYQSTPTDAGGKGGAFTGKGSGQQYDYSASFIVSLGEQIAGVQAIFNASKYDFLVAPSDAIKAALQARGIKVKTGNIYGGTFLLGDYAQAPWSYMVTAHPDQALNYRGEALACFPNMALGSAPAIPNFNFEILWKINTDVEDVGPDANPADWVQAFLSDPDWGVGFPVALLQQGDVYAANDVYALPDAFTGFTDYQLWARAAGLLVSPLLDGQVAANSHLADLMQGTIADFVWSGGQLKIVPYADFDYFGTDFTYTAAVTPIYDLGEADLMAVEHGPSTGDGPTLVKTTRADPTLVPNQLAVEYLDRASLYNAVSITEQDDASILASGRTRPDNPRQHHFFCLRDAASVSASLQMRRKKVLQTFYFRLPPQFIILDPMDFVTLPVGSQALYFGTQLPIQTTVRITEIKKGSDGSLAFTAEEYLGIAGPALYTRQEPLGAGHNVNEDPGNTNPPIMFEPTDSLAGALEVWVAVSGMDPTIWGGCNIWVASEDGGTYKQVGQINGASRMGVLTAPIPAVAAASLGQTIDNANVLSVDLSMSNAALSSGSLTDMTALNTRVLVGDEIMAYQTATLTGAEAYDLSPLVRGAYDTAIAAHAVGTRFLRLDGQVFSYPFTQDRIGGSISIKFQSFNVFGGGLQDLADIGATVYTFQGTALASPLPDVTNLRATFVDNTSAITWDEVTDFRSVRYEIRRGGTAWDNAQSLGTLAHPPFETYGDGVYWVKAVAQPTQGLIVTSDNAATLQLFGTVITDNVFDSYDDAGAGWLGKITGFGAISGGDFMSLSGDAYSAADFYAVADIFDTTATTSYYESARVLDAYYDRAVRLNPVLEAQGVSTTADFLGDPDFLNNPDIFGTAATASIDSWLEVYVAGDIAGDIYATDDIYALPDAYGGTTGSWTKFAPGTLVGRWFKFRVAAISYDPSVIAVISAFSTEIDVKNRIDHTTNHVLSAAGETVTFTPDSYARAVPFKYGPSLDPLPMVLVAVLDGATGDYYTVTALTLSSCFVRCFNAAGAGVSRTVNIYVEGA